MVSAKIDCTKLITCGRDNVEMAVNCDHNELFRYLKRSKKLFPCQKKVYTPKTGK